MTKPPTPIILAFAGSLRAESWNRKLLELAVEQARSAGAHVEHIDLNDYTLPFLSQDLESDPPPEALLRLRELFTRADGLLIASPEYNGFISSVLKNTLDWLSRPDISGGHYQPSFGDKVAAIMGASPGERGAVRGLKNLRELLGNLRTEVVEGQVGLGSAFKAFDDDGELVDSDARAALDHTVAQLMAAL